jgi:phosphoenolpyruvate carboxylase
MDVQADKDLPLKEDTRLLGRLLGNVLRAQTGEAGFARIEAIRQTAIRFRRAGPAEAPGIKRELDALLNDLPIGQALDVVRAFNISRIWSTSPRMCTRTGAVALMRWQDRARSWAASPRTRSHNGGGDDHGTLRRWFADVLVSPVLTAHPPKCSAGASSTPSARSRGSCNGAIGSS